MADGIVEALWMAVKEPLRALIAEELAKALAVPRATPLLTTEQLAQVLGVSSKTIGRLREQGLPVIFVGESPRFELERVLTWFRDRARVATATEGLRAIEGGKR